MKLLFKETAAATICINKTFSRRLFHHKIKCYVLPGAGTCKAPPPRQLTVTRCNTLYGKYNGSSVGGLWGIWIILDTAENCS